MHRDPWLRACSEDGADRQSFLAEMRVQSLLLIEGRRRDLEDSQTSSEVSEGDTDESEVEGGARR